MDFVLCALYEILNWLPVGYKKRNVKDQTKLKKVKIIDAAGLRPCFQVRSSVLYVHFVAEKSHFGSAKVSVICVKNVWLCIESMSVRESNRMNPGSIGEWNNKGI